MVTAEGTNNAGRENRSGRRRWWVLVLLCSPFFVVVSDSTIVYAALPSIDAGLGFDGSGVEWVVIAYLLTSGGLLLLGGRVADLLGRRRVFLTGVGLFTGMSLLCGLAWSDGVLVAARALEGAAAAIMVPAALSLLMASFPEGAERNRALGVWGSLAGLGATAGLLLGGPITEWFDWRWVFLVNVPVGLVVLAAVPALLPPDGPRLARRGRFDLGGAVTVTLALFALVSAIVDAPRHSGIAASTVALLAVAALLTAWFIVIERRVQDPLVPLRLFRSRSLVAGNLVVLVAGMGVDGLLFTFTVFAQDVLRYSAIQFGLAMSVMTLVSLGGVVLGQHLVTRVSAGAVAIAGVGLIGAGALLLARMAAGAPSAGKILVALAIFGAGTGAAFVAGQIAALQGVDGGDSGLAAGLEETTFAVGSALGVAIVATLMGSPVGPAGSRAAFLGAAGFAALGLAAAALLLIPGVRARTTKRAVSIALLESGATALTKWASWGVAALGGSAAVSTIVTGFWQAETTPVRVAIIAGIGLLLSAVVLTLGVVVRADVTARGTASGALYAARAAVATGFLSGATMPRAGDQDWMARETRVGDLQRLVLDAFRAHWEVRAETSHGPEVVTALDVRDGTPGFLLNQGWTSLNDVTSVTIKTK